jgi:hypothetical protein
MRAWSSREAVLSGSCGISALASAGARASAMRNSSSANCARTLSSGAARRRRAWAKDASAPARSPWAVASRAIQVSTMPWM